MSSPLEQMREAELQSAVLELAQVLGWKCYHTFDSRRSQRGFPDLCMVRGERLVFVELKSQAGKIRPEQQEWLDALDEADAETYVWRPGHYLDGVVEAILRA